MKKNELRLHVTEALRVAKNWEAAIRDAQAEAPGRANLYGPALERALTIVAHLTALELGTRPWASSPAAPKRYFRIEEMDHVDDTTGVGHTVVATDFAAALAVLSGGDFGDAKRMEIVEIDEDQASMIYMHDDGRGRIKLTDAELGAWFSEEY